MLKSYDDKFGYVKNFMYAKISCKCECVGYVSTLLVLDVASAVFSSSQCYEGSIHSVEFGGEVVSRKAPRPSVPIEYGTHKTEILAPAPNNYSLPSGEGKSKRVAQGGGQDVEHLGILGIKTSTESHALTLYRCLIVAQDKEAASKASASHTRANKILLVHSNKDWSLP